MVSLVKGGGDATLTVRCHTVLDGTRVGDSIAVNGVCLTAASVNADSFVANVQPVTLRRTNLGGLRPGAPVNLERSLAADGRFGGHYVQGHVDATGRLVALTRDGAAIVATIQAPPEVLRYVVDRGFIAVDGVSLTVAALGRDHFRVSLVAHTQEHITLPRQSIGAAVNLEVDVFAKYVERLIATGPPREVDWELLRRAGFE